MDSHSLLTKKQKQYITQIQEDDITIDPELRTETLFHTMHPFYFFGCTYEYTKDQNCVLVILLTQIYNEM